jgi:hypothetical protein
MTLIIRITAYDNGMVQVDGIPINDHRDPDPVHGWLGAVDVVTSTIALFQREKSAPGTPNGPSQRMIAALRRGVAADLSPAAPRARASDHQRKDDRGLHARL